MVRGAVARVQADGVRRSSAGGHRWNLAIPKHPAVLEHLERLAWTVVSAAWMEGILAGDKKDKGDKAS
jgi:hypothetical protein